MSKKFSVSLSRDTHQRIGDFAKKNHMSMRVALEKALEGLLGSPVVDSPNPPRKNLRSARPRDTSSRRRKSGPPPSFCALCSNGVSQDRPVSSFVLRPIGKDDAMVWICGSCDKDPVEAFRGPDLAYSPEEL